MPNVSPRVGWGRASSNKGCRPRGLTGKNNAASQTCFGGRHIDNLYLSHHNHTNHQANVATKLAAQAGQPSYFKGKLPYLAAKHKPLGEWPELLPLSPSTLDAWASFLVCVRMPSPKILQGHKLRPACILISYYSDPRIRLTPAVASQHQLGLPSQLKWQFPRPSSAIDDLSACTCDRQAHATPLY